MAESMNTWIFFSILLFYIIILSIDTKHQKAVSTYFKLKPYNQTVTRSPLKEMICIILQ